MYSTIYKWYQHMILTYIQTYVWGQFFTTIAYFDNAQDGKCKDKLNETKT